MFQLANIQPGDTDAVMCSATNLSSPDGRSGVYHMITPHTFRSSQFSQIIFVTIIAIIVWVALCTLGYNPENVPINSVAVIWPGAILHGSGAILLGGWGIVATIVSTMIVDAIKVGSPYAIFGYMLPSFLQSFIPASYYRYRIRKYGWGEKTFAFIPFLTYAVIINNLVGAASGTLVLYLGTGGTDSLFFPFIRWLISNIPISLILGWPLFHYLGPVMAEEGLSVSGWWK